MARPSTGRMWDDPRVKKILVSPKGAPIDLSQFTKAELRQLALESIGRNPRIADAPRLGLALRARKSGSAKTNA